MFCRFLSMIRVGFEVRMIPYSYNMVDMGGIDLAEANGTVVPGVYERITEAMNLCGDVILYNWKFAEINIAPSAYSILHQTDSILINGLIQVTELDQITVIGLPPPLVPVSPLIANENGVYEADPPQSGFNPVRVEVPERTPVIQSLEASSNGTYLVPEGVDGFNPVAVTVPSIGNLYTNGVVAPGEQITDLTGFTLLYTTSIRFGNNGAKVAARLAISDESSHSTLQAGGWAANGMCSYDAENLIGAYGGYDFGQEIFITKAKFWLNRYSGQNKTLIATVEYFDGTDWHELEDIQITTNLEYPSHIFEVQINRAVNGVRWIHKKEPNKSSGNNLTFAGMSVYRKVGDPINVYIPDRSGLITPPDGYDGFGPLFIV